jgi:hypothetical protein
MTECATKYLEECPGREGDASSTGGARSMGSSGGYGTLNRALPVDKML